MSDPMTTMTMASFGLASISIVTFAGYRGWQGWLDVRKLELTGTVRKEPRSQAGDLIEMADLRERVRKLENIAACIDL
jgi:hypothetical protein